MENNAISTLDGKLYYDHCINCSINHARCKYFEKSQDEDHYDYCYAYEKALKIPVETEGYQ
jgi:hypothetical protein